MFPCVSSYRVPLPGSACIALISSLLSFAIGNKISSGIPNENRVIDLSPISNELYTSAIKSITSLLSGFTDGCVVAGTDRRMGL